MLTLSGQPLKLEQICDVAIRGEKVCLGEDAQARVRSSRGVVEAIIERGETVYGVNTGFGKLSEVTIPISELGRLQLNLVRSHACGVGTPLSIPETRALMLLRANVLAAGFSGARLHVLECLLDMLNQGVHPVVPEQGSVGASGDLAPLAHLALGVIGEGECHFRGERIPTAKALATCGIQSITLAAKEGLALLNGTQAIGATGSLALSRVLSLIEVADLAGAMSLEALLGTPVAFDPQIQDARPHPGQLEAAANLRRLLEGSEIRDSHLVGDPRVQDAYSLRCMPQVHGAVRGAMRHVQEVLFIESGSGTDNPLVFSETGDVLSGGNFHGAPLAMALDYAAIAVTELANISERRIERLINPDINEHLPPFLTKDPGCSSGFMIPHVTAVALINECKVLSHPASVDNLPTSGGKEDHVSMGMTAALKLRRIVDNVERVLAIELLAAAEGLEYRRPLKAGKGVEQGYQVLRKIAAPVLADRALTDDIENVAQAVREGAFKPL